MIHEGLHLICPHCGCDEYQQVKKFDLFIGGVGKDVRYTVDRCSECEKTFSIQVPVEEE